MYSDDGTFLSMQLQFVAKAAEVQIGGASEMSARAAVMYVESKRQRNCATKLRSGGSDSKGNPGALVRQISWCIQFSILQTH